MPEPQPPLREAKTPRPLAAMLWMVVTGILFVAVTATVKHGAQGLPAAESAFLRYFLGLAFLLPMLKGLREARLSKRQKTLFWIRGFAHSIAIICWFHAMTRITIAEVTAMNYMSPIYVTLGAAIFLGERLAAPRIMAIAAGFLGALIILRPGFRELTDGHFAMMAAAMFFAVSYLTAKRMADQVSATAIVAMLSITVTVCLLPVAAVVWVMPNLSQVFWIFVVACFATAGHYTMTLAFANAPVSVTQPVVFLQLVWSVLTGALFFSEPADSWVILGGAVIIGAATFIAIREAMLKRRSPA